MLRRLWSGFGRSVQVGLGVQRKFVRHAMCDEDHEAEEMGEIIPVETPRAVGSNGIPSDCQSSSYTGQSPIDRL